MLTVENLFGLVLRLAGVFLICFTILDATHVMAMLIGFPLESRHSISTDLIAAVEWFVLGTSLLFGADVITRIVYRGRKNAS